MTPSSARGESPPVEKPTFLHSLRTQLATPIALSDWAIYPALVVLLIVCAIVEPSIVDAGDENAAAMRLAGPPACVGDPYRRGQAEAFRSAAMQLGFRHHRLLQVPALAGIGRPCGDERQEKSSDQKSDDPRARHAPPPWWRAH